MNKTNKDKSMSVDEILQDHRVNWKREVERLNDDLITPLEWERIRQDLIKTAKKQLKALITEVLLSVEVPEKMNTTGYKRHKDGSYSEWGDMLEPGFNQAIDLVNKAIKRKVDSINDM